MARKEEIGKLISIEENKLQNIDSNIKKTKKMIKDCKSTLKVLNNIFNRDYKNLDEEQVEFMKLGNIEFEKTILSLNKLLGTLLRIKSKRIN
jgi:hypothetical protein